MLSGRGLPEDALLPGTACGLCHVREDDMHIHGLLEAAFLPSAIFWVCFAAGKSSGPWRLGVAGSG